MDWEALVFLFYKIKLSLREVKWIPQQHKAS